MGLDWEEGGTVAVVSSGSRILRFIILMLYISSSKTKLTFHSSVSHYFLFLRSVFLHSFKNYKLWEEKPIINSLNLIEVCEVNKCPPPAFSLIVWFVCLITSFYIYVNMLITYMCIFYNFLLAYNIHRKKCSAWWIITTGWSVECSGMFCVTWVMVTWFYLWLFIEGKCLEVGIQGTSSVLECSVWSRWWLYGFIQFVVTYKGVNG